jgi:hypothetical protein
MQRVSNIDLFGGDIIGADRRPVSLDECEAICSNNYSCKGYTFVRAKRWCWPKSAFSAATRKGGVVSGLKPGFPIPALEPSPSSMRQLHNVDLFGGDIDDRRPVSLAECETICVNDHNCRGYTFVRAKQWCWLKSEIGTAANKGGVTSGVKSDVPEPAIQTNANMERFENTDFQQGDIPGSDRKPVSLEECEALCQRDSSCRAYTWVRAKGWCWPKYELGTPMHKPGMVSGHKH